MDDVAVKVFDQGLTPEQAIVLAESLTRLCQAPLAHPSIVRPITADAAGDLAWMAEAWVDGTPLDGLIDGSGPRPPAEVLRRITQLAAALDFAAAVGIYHGALHPSDILFAGDRAMVTGLGIMQALSQSGLDVPMSGAGVSPQRALGLPVTHTDDIYSLAAIAVEMLYGQSVENRRKIAAIVRPLAGVNHARLRDVLEGSLAEDPGDRPSTALEFAGALQTAIGEAPVAAPRPVPIAAPAPVPIAAPPVPIAAPTPVSIAAPPPVLVEAPDPTPMSLEEHELPLRPVPPAVSMPVFAPNMFHAEPAPTGVRVSWFGVAVGLAIGLLAGFAGGFVVGQRDATPVPVSASRAIPRAQREPAPTSTTGQDFTESAVPQSQAAEPDVKPPVSNEAPPVSDRTARSDRTPRSASTDPGRVEVVSRPAGAQVFLDGRLVGRTPLMLSEVAAGTHAVRIALPGHQRWVTSVDVTPGTHARVAASLER